MAIGFSDPRVKLHICDGIKYVQDAEEGSYDAIIVDSSDPVGPAEVLFEKVRLESCTNGVRVRSGGPPLPEGAERSDSRARASSAQ